MTRHPTTKLKCFFALSLFASIAALVSLVIHASSSRRESLDLSIPVIWSGDGGISVSADGGQQLTQYACNECDSYGPSYPYFALSEKDLFIWAPAKNAVLKIANNGSAKSFRLSQKIPLTEVVHKICLTPNGVYLNLVKKNDPKISTRVVKVSFENGRSEFVKGIIAIRSSGVSPNSAIVQKSGKMVIHFRGRTRMLQVSGPVHSWDFDANSGTVAVISGHNPHRVQVHEFEGKNAVAETGQWFSAFDVNFSDGGGQIWVSVNSQFYSRSEIWAYARDGVFLGSRLRTQFPIKAPMMDADDSVHELLKKIRAVQ